MTALAIRGSRFHNGVSRIHGGVSSRILRRLWPQIDPQENRVGYITNGVHVPTFLAQEWADVFEQIPRASTGASASTDRGLLAARGRDSRPHVLERAPAAQGADAASGAPARARAALPQPAAARRTWTGCCKFADPANPNVLTIGFARRFATYKRATLLFDGSRLAARRSCATTQRPVLLLFAGKAHPADEPGQELIRRIVEVARMPRVRGPRPAGGGLRPAPGAPAGVGRGRVAEQSGLSAGGARHVGHEGGHQRRASTSRCSTAGGARATTATTAGRSSRRRRAWTTRAATARRRRTLYELLQDHVIPLYYERGDDGLSRREWIRMAKHSIATLLPRFNSTRMVGEYLAAFYLPATQRGHHVRATTATRPRASWRRGRRTCARAGPTCGCARVDMPKRKRSFGERVRFEVGVAAGRPEARGRRGRAAARPPSGSSPATRCRRAAATASRRRRDDRAASIASCCDRAGDVRQARVSHPRLSASRCALAPLRDGPHEDGILTAS